jgi:nitrate reductase alpha subunit
MSKFLDRFRYFKQKGETFADGHGQLLNTNRDWEDGYRQRWQHDKIVRSTHGVNCTGSCSWKIYVKNGLVTWETQQPTIRVLVRICPTTSLAAARVVPAIPGISTAQPSEYPLMRKRLMKMWREAKDCTAIR